MIQPQKRPFIKSLTGYQTRNKVNYCPFQEFQMAGEKISPTDYEKTKRRLEFMEKAAARRGIHATKIEPRKNGGVDNFADGVSPYLELYWSLETGGEDLVAAELCLWFMDNPDHAHTYCLYVRYSGRFDNWEFGYARETDAKYGSPRAKVLAKKAFGFGQTGTREIGEPAALTIINALCAGFASTLPKSKNGS